MLVTGMLGPSLTVLLPASGRLLPRTVLQVRGAPIRRMVPCR